MPPKRGTKRKATKQSTAEQNGDAPLAPPDRLTWPGWVEMESEPAFFNVMLRELGVKGVRIQEVMSLDEEMLAFLPRPVHALIFLFQHKGAEIEQTETECPSDVWFANQIPDFACASVALLNVVNNIEGVKMGKKMSDFKDFTTDLDPMARGDAIDSFDFLKRVHNSFARGTDLLNADMHMRNKANRANKRQAVAKAQATKAAKKAAHTPEEKRADSAVTTPERTSKRVAKPAPKEGRAKEVVVADSEASSPLSDPPDSDTDFPSKPKKGYSPPPGTATRRSGRQPKPRKDLNTDVSEAAETAPPEQEGYHYTAYIPINGKVWQLDGLDSYPHLVGEFDAENGGDWLNVAGPEIQARMLQFQDGAIEFNVQAVVHDPMATAKEELARNVRELQVIDAKLDAASADWKNRDGADLSRNQLVLGPCPLLDLEETEIAAAPAPNALEEEIARHKDRYVDELVKLRQQRVKAQAPLRGSVRDQLESTKDDDEKARMRRHDFGAFVKGWLGALAEQEVLKGLVDEALE